MCYRFTKNLVLRAALLAALLISGQLGAEERVIEEIVVTAQKREQSLQDVPISASVTSGDTITEQAFTTLDDLSAKIPTVKFAQTAVADLINIRGFGSGNNMGFEQAVSTFVDGAYRGRAISRQLALMDVERVEVLKGPQTTYFGANATAGAFNIVSKRSNPGDETETNVSAYYQPEYGDYTLDLGTSVSLSDTFSIRLAGKLYGSDGYVENRTLDRDEPAFDDWAGRASFAWEPTDNFRMDFRVDGGDIDRDGGGSPELNNCRRVGQEDAPAAGVCLTYLDYADSIGAQVDDRLDWKTDGGGTTSHHRADFTEFALTNAWDLESGRITSVTTYYEHDSDRLATPLPIPIPNNAGQIGATLPARIFEDFSQWSQELRFESSIGDNVEYTAGLFYLQNDLEVQAQVGLFFVPPIPPLTGYQLDMNQDQTIASAFFAGDWYLTEHTAINFGVRYSEVDKEGDQFQFIGTLTSIPSLDTIAPFPNPLQQVFGGIFGIALGQLDYDDHNDDGFMPSIGVSHDFTDDVMGYIKYTEGFKSGGFAYTSSVDVFDKEEVKGYELGLKARLLDGKMSLSAAIFLNEYDDLQESGNRSGPSGAAETFVANVGRAESEGLEIGMTWLATNSLTIRADVAYLDSIYDEFTNATCDEITISQGLRICDLSGETRPFAPEWSGFLAATWEIPIESGTVLVEPSVDFSQSYYTLPALDQISKQDSYEKWNLRVAYEHGDGEWSVALVGKNLTDEATSNFRNIVGGGAPGSGAAYLSPPRTVGIQFNWRG